MTITDLGQVRASPLHWPDAQPRTSPRKVAPFAERSMATGIRAIEDEMRRWNLRQFTISMDPAHLRGTADPGVALWFLVKRRDRLAELRVLACDTFTKRELNLHALAVTLNDLRRIERYGTYSTEQATEGMRPMLPPPSAADGLDWKAIFGGVPEGIRKDRRARHHQWTLSPQVGG